MPDAMPARVTGTDPVSECEAGVPGEPDADPDERVAERDLPVGLPSFHSRNIVTNPSSTNT